MALEQFLQSMGTGLINFLPGLLAAVVTLAIGFILGHVLGTLTKKVVVWTKVDKFVGERENLPFKLANVLELVVRWWLYLVFIQQATIFLGVVAITEFVASVISFVPGLVEAGLLIVVGYAIASYLKDTFMRKHTIYSDIVGKIIFFLTIYVSIALALPFVGINPRLIENILLVIVASFGLGIALAVGLGLKEVIAESARVYFGKFKGRKKK